MRPIITLRIPLCSEYIMIGAMEVGLDRLYKEGSNYYISKYTKGEETVYHVSRYHCQKFWFKWFEVWCIKCKGGVVVSIDKHRPHGDRCKHFRVGVKE